MNAVMSLMSAAPVAATVVSNDTTSVKISEAATRALVAANQAVNSAVFTLERLEQQREEWEGKELAASRARLYSLLTDCYSFYLTLKTDKRAVIRDQDAFALELVFVKSRLIRVLKPAPATDVIDQHQGEIRHTRFDIGNQLLQGCPPAEGQATFTLVGIGAHDLDVAPLGVLQNLVSLVVGGILLMLGGHAHVLGGAQQSGLRWWWR